MAVSSLIFSFIGILLFVSVKCDIEKTCVIASWGNKTAPPYYLDKMELEPKVREGSMILPKPADCRLYQGAEISVCDDAPALANIVLTNDLKIKRTGHALTSADIYTTVYCQPYLGARRFI